MCVSTVNISKAWRKWELAFRTYHATSELNRKEAATQIAIQLHCAGKEAQEIFSNFTFNEHEDQHKVEDF